MLQNKASSAVWGPYFCSYFCLVCGGWGFKTRIPNPVSWRPRAQTSQQSERASGQDPLEPGPLAAPPPRPMPPLFPEKASVWGCKKPPQGNGTLISEPPRFSTPCEMRFFPCEKGKTAFSKRKALFEKAIFPFSRGKNRISQRVENRGAR